MKKLAIVGVDLSKNVFQLHGADGDGHVVFAKKVSRACFLKTLGRLPACIVAMEAFASSHYWGREVTLLHGSRSAAKLQ